jgi:RNA polymerase sigma-70 factor, ECF subfamily
MTTSHRSGHVKAGEDRAARFREAAHPCIDDAYRLAYFLLRDPADAEDAVQECYLRALRSFESRRGGAIRPWLLSILRHVCYSEFARRGGSETPADVAMARRKYESDPRRWQEPAAQLDYEIPDRQEGAAIRQIMYSLPARFREIIVMREFNDMSYREIAEVVGVPLDTVMSSLARARAILLTEWQARNNIAQKPSDPNSLVRSQGRPGIVANG